MTRARRLLAVAAMLAAAAVVSSSTSWGDNADRKDRARLVRDEGRPVAAPDTEAALAVARFAQGGVVAYQTAAGDTLFALQVQPALPAVAARPRDTLILLCTSASQAGAPWFAARQIAEAVVKNAGDNDRVSVWTVDMPEATKNLTEGFASPKQDAKKFAENLARLKNDRFPAGDTDLKNGLSKAINTFQLQDGRQRILLYLGDGMSTHDPITTPDRVALCKDMVDRKVTFFPVPLGVQFHPENLHGLATGTGGLVVRVKTLEEKLDDAMKSLQAAFATPVLYPTRFEVAGATEHFPTRLPPLRSDAPTLVIGRMKEAKSLSYTVDGIVDGRRTGLTVKKTEEVPAAELDNYFLVSMVNQWKNARDQHALIRGDRALVFAYEQNRLQHQELLLSAQLALQDNQVDAAGRLYERALTLVPHDGEAAAGLKVVANLRDGKITRETLRQQLDKLDRQILRLGKDGKTVRLKREDLLQLALLGDNARPARAGGLPALAGDDLLQAQRDRVVVEEQKTTQLVEENLRQAHKALPTEPDDARELLRSTLLRVSDHPDLGDKVRSDLVNRLQSELRNVQLQGAAIKLRQSEQKRIKERVAGELRRTQQVQAEQDRVEGQFRVFKNLMHRARVEEIAMREVLAGLVALRQEALVRGTPVPQAVESAYFHTSLSYNLEQMTTLRRRKEQGFLATMLSVSRSAVPFSDEPPVNFPPLSTWKAITLARKDKYESMSLPDDPVARAEATHLYKVLEQPIETKDYTAPNITLKEFLSLLDEKFTRKGIELPILIDFEAFKEENPDAYKEESDLYDIKVKIPQVPRRMALATMLRIALSKIPTNNATYLIRRNFIEVTTIARQTQEKVTRVYPVTELVLPINPFGPNNPAPNPYASLGGGAAGLSGFAGVAGIGGGFAGVAGFGGLAGMGGIGGLAGIGGAGFPGVAGFGGAAGFPGVAGFAGGAGFPGVAGFGGAAGFPGVAGIGGAAGFPGVAGFGGAAGFPVAGFGGAAGFPGAVGFAGAAGFPGAAGLAGVGGVAGIGGVGGLAGLAGGAMGQNCLGFNLGGFNGNLGTQGSTQDQLLIALIRQTVAPGEWGAQNCQNPLLAQAFGMAGGLAPVNQPEDLTRTNTIGFYPPALALVVRGTTRLQTKLTGGVLGGVPRREAPAAAAAAENPRRRGLLGEGDEEVDPAARKGKAKETPVHEALDARKVWQAALEYGVSDPGLILATADFLADHGKFHDAAEFLKANLRIGICVRPWVYEALAVALTASGGAPEDIRRARLSAVALNPHDVQGFLNGARALADARQWDRSLAFCRQAAQLEPNVPTVYADALNYAELARDSKAMEWAVGNLLSQDWPLDNRFLHLKAQAKLEVLAQVLEAEGRKVEADRMRTTLTRLRERDVVLQLTWQDGTGPADLEFSVKEPGGSVCSSQQRQTPGGGILLGSTLSEHNRATYVAAQAFAGTYEVTIKSLWGRPLGARATLEIIQHQGTPQETRRVATVPVGTPHTLKVVLTEGRRTSLATVPPPDAQRRTGNTEEQTPGRLQARLRDLADPDFSEYQKTTGTVGSPGAARAGSDEAVARPQGEHLAYQAAVAPAGSAVDLTARAVLSEDQRTIRLSMTPVFETVQRTSGPIVNLPIIPGGTSA